jgi:hypothetical protein
MSGDGAFLLAVYVLVLTTIIGLGGLFHAANGKNFGWRVFDMMVAVQAFNCISLFVYFLQ